MKPSASFFLNIKPHTSKGERSIYVMELVLALKKDVGFRFVDEFCWTKNPFPGRFVGRFKNAWEPVYHFSKSKPSILMFNPYSCATLTKKLSKKRFERSPQCTGDPKNGSGMAMRRKSGLKDRSLPSNVINVNNVSNQFSAKKEHPATFPVGLVDFFIKSFTNPDDIVLDPFCGSGTTLVSALNLGRDAIGIDLLDEYISLSKRRINEEVRC